MTQAIIGPWVLTDTLSDGTPFEYTHQKGKVRITRLPDGHWKSWLWLDDAPRPGWISLAGKHRQVDAAMKSMEVLA